jgi:hypothetical protein
MFSSLTGKKKVRLSSFYEVQFSVMIETRNPTHVKTTQVEIWQEGERCWKISSTFLSVIFLPFLHQCPDHGF